MHLDLDLALEPGTSVACTVMLTLLLNAIPEPRAPLC